MIELRKRSPTLPRTYQKTAGNEGNSPERLTMNSALGFEKQRTNVGKNILSMESDISNEDQVFLKYISQKLVKSSTDIISSVATNLNGVAPLTSSNLVDNSRAIPAASYRKPDASYSSAQISRSWTTSRNIQTTMFPFRATVMSLTSASTGQPAGTHATRSHTSATQKRRLSNLFKRHRIQPDTKYAKPATGISSATRSLQYDGVLESHVAKINATTGLHQFDQLSQ
ncbi:hypothetical protein F511_40797 [Dorcoceras hygrometricum]|uniref:Uncharacterized protein n=1 Tax=Dorcoceras hygrometricum TaxID=472368 RepID=A0A2Z7CS81_9LAMI|nr:hypothetical protein F511_40797 [Dorcoceras hygrometricum]